MSDQEPRSHRRILVLPGGGYTRHAPHEGEPVAEWIRSLGWGSRVVHYPVGDRAPQALHHVREEVAAERRSGASVVGLIGFSAGGHAAGLAALADGARPDERVDFAILGYPVVSMSTPTHAGSQRQLLGIDPSSADRAAASLENLVSDDTVPFFLWHTAEDPVVPIAEHTYRLCSAMAAAGRPHELHVFPGDVHGIGLARDDRHAAAWTSLCATWLARHFDEVGRSRLLGRAPHVSHDGRGNEQDDTDDAEP